MPGSFTVRVTAACLAVLVIAGLAACAGDTHKTGVRSVKDFGAIGNGVADDTHAILRAVAAGPAYLPPGTYRVSDLTLPDGATLTGAGPSSYIHGAVRCGSAVSLTALKVGIAGTPFLSASDGATV